MVVRWSALPTRVGVSGVEPFPSFREEVPKGSLLTFFPQNIVVGYCAVRARVGHRCRGYDHLRARNQLKRLRDILSEWPSDREVASEDKLRSLIGWLLHLCEVLWPGKYFARRMLNHLGLLPVRAWSAEFHASRTHTASSSRVRLGPEFHTDVSFWCLLVAGELGCPAGCFSAPLYRSYMQSAGVTLWSDASGDSMGEFVFVT